jgi:hypothetical protein
MHLNEALQAIRWEAPSPSAIRPPTDPGRRGNLRQELFRGRHFRLSRLELGEPLKLSSDGRSFQALFANRGGLQVTGGGVPVMLHQATSCLLPAGLREALLEPASSGATVLVITI